jgi:hypothetical protein
MQMTFNGREQIFEGIGFYKSTKEGSFDETWFDSGGEIHPLKSIDDGKMLTT